MTALVPELYVTSLEASLAFYRHLGFTIQYRRPGEGFARIARGAAELMLEEPHGRTWLLAPLSRPRGVGVNLTIVTTGVDALYAELPQGTAVLLPPETKQYQRATDTVAVRQFVVADPDGYLLRFSETLAITPARLPAKP